MKYGELFRNIRKEKNMKIADFASQLGITREYLSSIENNRNIPSKFVLNKLVEHSGVPIEIMQWFELNDDNIPKHKIDIFRRIKPKVDDLLKEFINV